MKTKIKNIIFSLVIAIALLFSSNFSLAFAVVNNSNQISLAKYEAKDLTNPYEFTAESGWDHYYSEGTSSNYTAKVSTNLITSTLANKPTTKYDGTTTSSDDESSKIDDFAMSIVANDAPSVVDVTEKIDDVTQYKKNPDGSYIYEQDGNTDKIYSESELTGDKNAYELITEEGENKGKYKKKIVSIVEENSYYYLKTKSALELKANNWYVVTAWVYTTPGNFATLAISGTNFNAEITLDESEGVWKQYYLFLEASSETKNNVNISFYFGSKDGLIETPAKGTNVSGAVFIDNLCVKTISKTDYNNKTIDGVYNANAKIDYYDEARYDINIEGINNDFQDALDVYDYMYGETSYNATNAIASQYQKYIDVFVSGSTTEKLTENQLNNLRRAYEKLKISIIEESEEFHTMEDKKDAEGNVIKDGNDNPVQEKVLAPSTFNPNNKSLKLENKSEKYPLGLLSTPITIKQFGYYKLSLYVKGTEATDEALVKLVSYIKTGKNSSEGVIQTKSQTVTAFTKTSDITNNWTEVSFYIQGSSYRDTTFQIALLAGTESTVYFDDIRLETITSLNYKNSSSSKKFDLSPTTTTISGGITNGYFNYITTENVDPSKNEAPYIPSDWSKIDNCSKNVTAGVVSTTDTYSNVYNKLGYATNPITIDSYGIALPKTNVLAMYVKEAGEKGETFGYKSSEFVLSSNSVYKISFEVYASELNTIDTLPSGKVSTSNFEGNIFANLVLSKKNIAEFDLSIADSDVYGNWIKYTIVVRTGSSSRTCHLQLGIENAKSGTVFFQKVGYTKLAEKTVDEEKISVDTQYADLEKEFDTVQKQNDNNIKFVNFDSNPFVMHSNEFVTDKNYYSSLSHSLKTETVNNVDQIVKNQGTLGVADISNDLVLSDPSYILTKDFLANEKLNSQFALFIYNAEDNDTTVNPNTSISLSSSSYYQISIYVKTKDVSNDNGLTISMDKISTTFSKINTETANFGENDVNGYKKFTVLVKTGSSTISALNISYNLKNTGVALLAGLEVTKLANEDAYNNLVKDVNPEDKSTVIKDFSEVKTNTLDEDVDNLTLATFFLVFSSILLVAVLAFAIVAVYIKRKPKHKIANGVNNANVTKNNQDSNLPKDGFV